jgi:hypothetical protein
MAKKTAPHDCRNVVAGAGLDGPVAGFFAACRCYVEAVAVFAFRYVSHFASHALRRKRRPWKLAAAIAAQAVVAGLPVARSASGGAKLGEKVTVFAVDEPSHALALGNGRRGSQPLQRESASAPGRMAHFAPSAEEE